MQTKGNRKSGVTKKRGIRKTKKGGNKAERQKNRGLGRSKKMKGRTRRQPRIYGGFWPFPTRTARVAPAPAPAVVPRIQYVLDEPDEPVPKFVFVHTPAFPETPAQIAFNKALATNDFKIIESLLIRGDIDVNVAPNGKFTALYSAIKLGEYDIASLLLNAGAKIVKGNHFESAGNRYPLLIFLIMLHHKYNEVTLELINLVIDKISNQHDRDEIIDEISTNGYSALNYAIENNLEEIVEKLIPISTVARLSFALVIAAKMGRLDYVIALIEAGADVTAKNNYGETALDMAIMLDEREKPEKPRIIELLQAEAAKHAPPANAEPLPPPPPIT